MRHTFGTRLGEKGYTAYEVMALMRHRDIKTSSRYVHSTAGRKRGAVESIWDNSPHKIPTHGEQPTLVAVNG
jgi:integrase